MLFDLFSLWQTVFLFGAFVVKSSSFGWLLSSFDFFSLCFSGVFLTRNEIPVEAVLLQEKQPQDNAAQNDSDLLVGSKARSGSGKPFTIVNQVEPMMSVQQRSEEDSGASSRNRDVEEELDFGEVYIRKSRMWDFLILTFCLIVILGIVSYVVYARIQTYVVQWQGLPGLVYPIMLQWTLDQVKTKASPWILTVTGVALDSVIVVEQMMPSVFFVNVVYSFTCLADEYNERLRLAREEGFLDIDSTITYHHRLKTLTKRMSRCFGVIIFLIVFGDMLIIASASFLGLVKECRWLDGDSLCISYLARHLLLVSRLLIVLLAGSSIQLKLTSSILEMDGYMCKSILNTERLKILGMVSQTNNSSLSAQGFFNVTRPFTMGVLTLAVVYIAVMIRQG